jgi:hypothetical protein
MELVNATPLQAFAFRQFDQAGQLDCVVSVRGTFVHVQDGRAAWYQEQEPFQWQDRYDGDPHMTMLLRQTDLTPDKTGTDVTFLGRSFAPEGRAGTWTCGIEIGAVRKTLHVTGPRQWEPLIQKARWPFQHGEVKVVGWRLGEPDPVDSVAMDWALAAGGRSSFSSDEDEPDPRNPLGRGRLGDAADWCPEPRPAPQILASAQLKADDAALPAGFGPIPPFWWQRYRYAGTYDAHWEADRHPLLPTDFDPAFWQCAPEDQIVRPFLRGDESYRLTNLHAELPVATGNLPDLHLGVEVNGEPWQRLNLDSVQFDWRDDALVLLTWRARFPLPDAVGARIRLDRISAAGLDTLEAAE